MQKLLAGKIWKGEAIDHHVILSKNKTHPAKCCMFVWNSKEEIVSLCKNKTCLCPRKKGIIIWTQTRQNPSINAHQTTNFFAYVVPTAVRFISVLF